MSKETFIYNAKGDVNLLGVLSPEASSGVAPAYGRVTFNNNGTWISSVSPSGIGGGSGNYLSGGTLGSYFRLSYSISSPAIAFTVSPTLAPGAWHTLSSSIYFEVANADYSGDVAELFITVQKISNPSNTATEFITIGATGGCVAADTLVLLSDGTYKLAGDLVLTDTLSSFLVDGMIDTDQANWKSWNTTDISNRTEPTSGIVALQNFTKPSYSLINGVFKTTLTHTNFICRSGVYQWVSSQDVVVGDNFILRDGTLLPIISAEIVNAEQEFTYINVETVDTFFVKVGADTIVTHNAS